MNVFETAAEVKKAVAEINKASSLEKNKILANIKKVLVENESLILKENMIDIENAKKKNLPLNLIRRRDLNSNKIHEIAV